MPIVLVMLLLMTVWGCGLARVTRQGPEPETMIGGAGPLPQVPDADLTVAISPGGTGQSISRMEGMLPETYKVVGTFMTAAGQGHLARFQAMLNGDKHSCIEVVLPHSGSAGCRLAGERFMVSRGESQQDQGPRIRSVTIFGPSDVVAYEIDLGGFVVAIQPVDGAGYANWTGQGNPVAITAHFADGSIEDVPVNGSSS